MKKHSRKLSKRSVKYPLDWNALVLLIAATFVLWTLYRVLFRFPDWVDEIFMKAFLFGVPALLGMRLLRKSGASVGIQSTQVFPGLFLGLALGGMYGFAGVLASVARGVQIVPVQLFLAPGFWSTFFVALFTAWWESLFFFGFVQNAIATRLEKKRWGALFTAGLTSLVFLSFHAPLRLVQLGWSPIAFSLLLLLLFFAFGQSLVYFRTKNLYALSLSHLFWGMVLLIYSL